MWKVPESLLILRVMIRKMVITYSVGTIVLIALVGKVFFKERLSRRQIAAMGVILAALVLLNL